MELTSNGAVKCPQCGEDSDMHPEQVHIYWRKEDAKEGTHVVVFGDTVFCDRDLTRNPSPRRQGLEIVFECRLCAILVPLRIYQHKGQTLTTCGPSEAVRDKKTDG